MEKGDYILRVGTHSRDTLPVAALRKGRLSKGQLQINATRILELAKRVL